MKKSPAILAAVAMVSAAGAQEWQFELSNPVLSPASPSTFVTLSIDPGPGAYAFHAANLSVRGTEPGWSDLVALLSLGAPPFGGHPGQVAGSISGGDVAGISVGQLAGFGWDVRPGRIDVWLATFTATDFSMGRSVDVRTETSRFEVYTGAVTTREPREPRTPIEGRGQIVIVPAPAGLTLLGLGGAVLTRRRRRAAAPLRGRTP